MMEYLFGAATREASETAIKASIRAEYGQRDGASFFAAWEAGPSEEAAADAAESAEYWDNYDLAKTVAVAVVRPGRLAAARVLQRSARSFLARRSAQRLRVRGSLDIMEREVGKVQRAWRRRRAVNATRSTRSVEAETAKRWRGYEAFRARLLGAGEPVLMWDHANKCTVRAVLRVSRDRSRLKATLASRVVVRAEIPPPVWGYPENSSKIQVPPFRNARRVEGTISKIVGIPRRSRKDPYRTVSRTRTG